jgi:hypothetical protein
LQARKTAGLSLGLALLLVRASVALAHLMRGSPQIRKKEKEKEKAGALLGWEVGLAGQMGRRPRQTAAVR